MPQRRVAAPMAVDSRQVVQTRACFGFGERVQQFRLQHAASKAVHRVLNHRYSASMPSRREFVQLGMGAALAIQIADAQDVPENLEEATIVQLQSALTAGRWTSAQLLEKYLARIRDVDAV